MKGEMDTQNCMSTVRSQEDTPTEAFIVLITGDEHIAGATKRVISARFDIAALSQSC